jgi:hypothetical protein
MKGPHVASAQARSTVRDAPISASGNAEYVPKFTAVADFGKVSDFLANCLQDGCSAN